jgi:hypothetical protein
VIVLDSERVSGSLEGKSDSKSKKMLGQITKHCKDELEEIETSEKSPA